MTSLIRFSDITEQIDNTHIEAIEVIRARLIRNWESDSIEVRLALLADLVYQTHLQIINLCRI